MKEKNHKIKIMGALLCLISVVLAGCSFLTPGEVTEEQPVLTGLVSTSPGMYDSEDTSIVVKKDTTEQTIQLQNLATGKKYTLNYDGTTHIYDKYEQAISLEQIEPGSIVTVRFYKPKKQLASLTVSGQAMHFDELEGSAVDTKKGKITVGETVYPLSSHAVILSDEKQSELMDINQVDVLSVWGYNNQIYSIYVKQGHGYLRLQNDTYFVDGWIEIGQRIIRKITEDMLIVVPEGKTSVKVSHNGSSAVQEITFARNEEILWDLGDIEITEVQKGRIIFTMEPAKARVTIDGRNVDTSRPVELEYGVHQMTVTADGYDTLAQYIKVKEPSANIHLTLEKNAEADSETDEKEDEEEDGKEDNREDKTEEEEETAAGNTVASSNGKNQVYVNAPTGVEVYLDGNYVGIAPVSFEKKAGNYVITLRRTGYQTRSYTVQIDDKKQDIDYSFTELMKLDE